MPATDSISAPRRTAVEIVADANPADAAIALARYVLRIFFGANLWRFYL
jgi:hypothetical protein